MTNDDSGQPAHHHRLVHRAPRRQRPVGVPVGRRRRSTTGSTSPWCRRWTGPRCRPSWSTSPTRTRPTTTGRPGPCRVRRVERSRARAAAVAVPAARPRPPRLPVHHQDHRPQGRGGEVRRLGAAPVRRLDPGGRQRPGRRGQGRASTRRTRASAARCAASSSGCATTTPRTRDPRHAALAFRDAAPQVWSITRADASVYGYTYDIEYVPAVGKPVSVHGLTGTISGSSDFLFLPAPVQPRGAATGPAGRRRTRQRRPSTRRWRAGRSDPVAGTALPS